MKCNKVGVIRDVCMIVDVYIGRNLYQKDNKDVKFLYFIAFLCV